ncbi:MAG: hypothetical protein COB66_01290 [Coxiella sp. (in: Bacteria)]|nr:MAG: hypothetical protein COB66_01290 [Coxiella sp. (in: g-proteobacteria)]
MNFSELKSEVHLLTNRPDLFAETESAIKAATLKAHKVDFFSKDLYSTGVAFEDPGFRQSLDYVLLIPNFRAFKSFRLAENETDDTGDFIDIITIDEILDAYGRNRTNIGYVAGRVLELRAAVEFQFGLLTAYVSPIVTPEEDYSSWVAEQFPFTIIYEAARVIFTSIGQADKARLYRDMRIEEYKELGTSALTDVGS